MAPSSSRHMYKATSWERNEAGILPFYHLSTLRQGSERWYVSEIPRKGIHYGHISCQVPTCHYAAWVKLDMPLGKLWFPEPNVNRQPWYNFPYFTNHSDHSESLGYTLKFLIPVAHALCFISSKTFLFSSENVKRLKMYIHAYFFSNLHE